MLLIIPDVHGRPFWKYAIDNIDKYEKVIFLGDYLDPYPDEKISFEESVLNFKEILDFKHSNFDKVELLLGNHDMHYVDTGFMDCSRLNYPRRSEMNNLYSDNYKAFKLLYIYDGCLFSHAGVYDEWLKEHNLTIGKLQWDGFLDERQPALEAVGRFRGGWSLVGSCIWADIRESLRSTINKDYYQVFGHTQLLEIPYVTNHMACLDVRRCFELDTKTKEIIEIKTICN